MPEREIITVLDIGSDDDTIHVVCAFGFKFMN
jgi:hypothetical protein